MARAKPLYAYVVAHLDIDGKAAGPSKVGVSADPWNRLHSLQNGNPHRIVLFATFFAPHGDADRIESIILRECSSCRLIGEWLDMAPERLAAAIVDGLGNAVPEAGDRVNNVVPLPEPRKPKRRLEEGDLGAESRDPGAAIRMARMRARRREARS